MATRKTHIVRIYDDSSGTKDLTTYIDVEVLDACVFRRENGKEAILRLPAAKASPIIVDDLNLGVAKDPGKNASRKTHMKKVGDDKNSFAIEVLDAVTFRGASGKEWILKMPSAAAAPFNSSDGGSASGSTRRTHSEKVYFDPTDKGKDGADLVTVERCDAVAFRTVNAKEMILKMPSYDDGSGKRASTITTPENYDPTDDDMHVPENTDPHVYIKFLKDSQGLVTGKEKIAQGPLWWIRKIKSGSEWLVIEIDQQRKNTSSTFTFSSSVSSTINVTEFTETDKIMPFVENGAAGAKSKDLDLNVDLMLSGHRNSWESGGGNVESGDDSILTPPDWTTLVFINVALARKKADSSNDPIEVTVKFNGFPKPNADVTGIGYYSWAVSGGDQFTFVPIHPPPDATNALLPYPFNDATVSNYIGLWNGWILDAPQIREWNASGIPIPEYPDAGGFGWTTLAKAQAFVSAINARDTFESIFTPPTLFETLTIDFGAPPAGKQPHLSATVRALHYTGRVNFPYDANNVQQFPDPKLEADIVSASIDQGVPSKGITIKIVLDKKAGLSISSTETPQA